ncbi:MAG: RagB/SusD family nutrient uptake outer membrane protein [Bacteroides sp.]|nr:RagB/SusD family nutrient uptake outer membrane protein [Bacteroides sp.]
MVKKLFPSYSDSEKKALWAAAAKEAKEFIDKYVGNGYDLTRIYTDGKLDPYLSYREAVRGYKSEITNFNGNTSTIEMIWFNQRTASGFEQYSRTPKHFGVNVGWAQASGALGATQEIVDSYFMANGIKPVIGYQSDHKTPVINPVSGYEDSGFSETDYLDPVTGRVFAPAGVLKAWTNREPRFYADITFDGQKWLYDGQGDIYTSTQYSGNSGVSQGATNDYTKTGYIVRKSAPLEDWVSSDRACILMRLAQIYLDYCEALNESDPGNGDILKYLNLIRERAGIPTYGTGAGQLPVPSDMRQAIRDERCVELAFENVSYFDVRRWCIAEQTENKPVHGMDIRKDGEEFFVRTVMEDRTFEKKSYFFPIPSKDINISHVLVQNPGW